jgi:hypothetical protein
MLLGSMFAVGAAGKVTAATRTMLWNGRANG